MQVIIAKFLLGAAITIINAFGKKYLSYEQGLKVRKYIENSILTRMRKWTAKSVKITADDGLVAFFRGVLKSNTINGGIDHATPGL